MDPRISSRRSAVSRQQGRRRLHILVGALVLTLLLIGGWFLVHSPLFSARSITVTGDVHETAAQVVAAAGLADHPPLLAINRGAAAARIERLPWVSSATVTVSWPDGVHIAVTEEIPRLVIAAAGEYLGRGERRRPGSPGDVRGPPARAGPSFGARASRRVRIVVVAQGRGRSQGGHDVAPLLLRAGDRGDRRARWMGAVVHDDADRRQHRVCLAVDGQVRGRVVRPRRCSPPRRGRDRRECPRRPPRSRRGEPMR